MFAGFRSNRGASGKESMMEAAIKNIPAPTSDGGSSFRVRCPECCEIVAYRCAVGGALFVYTGCRS